MNYSIPSKVFILGEYVVLAQMPGIVAAVAPRFEMSEGSKSEQFHPESPLGKLEKWAENKGLARLPLQFKDPLHGAGGFGASTAQFAMGFAAYSDHYQLGSSTWEKAWDLYRELMADQPVPPSGADLVAQWQGGITLFSAAKKKSENLWPCMNWEDLLVFSATHQQGRKVATHHHLNDLTHNSRMRDSLFAKLEKPLMDGISSIERNNPAGLGSAMSLYAETLFQAGLEISATTEDRKELKSIAGVFGVKGTGALQSDGIIVLCETSARPEVIQVAQRRGLKLLCDGLTNQVGIKCQN